MSPNIYFMAQVIVRHTEEVRTLREQLKRQKNKTAQAEKKHRDASEELSMAQRKLKKAHSVINEKGLGERHDLARKLTKVEKDREEKEKRANVSTMERRRKEKNILWVLVFFFMMWAHMLRKSFNTFRIYIVEEKWVPKEKIKISDIGYDLWKTVQGWRLVFALVYNYFDKESLSYNLWREAKLLNEMSAVQYKCNFYLTVSFSDEGFELKV